jgi:oxygen-independent coproporphyrinogen-3 oxidase
METIVSDQNSNFLSNRECEYIRWYPKSLEGCAPSTRLVSSTGIAGIYVHVPFCREICQFCPFNKYPYSEHVAEQFVSAVCQELERHAETVAARHEGIHYLYFGGGTPSCLKVPQIERIIDVVTARFGISKKCEITFECHPLDASQDAMRALKLAGVNRISLGVQSFIDAALSALGSYHSSTDALGAIGNAIKFFDRVGIDLLFDYESQTQDDWSNVLNQVKNLHGIGHVSAYSTIDIKSNKPRDKLRNIAFCEQTLGHFERLGMHHYASCSTGSFDFSFSDHECKYEVGHWRAPQDEFLAVGPGALGFVGECTTANCLRIQNYLGRVARDESALISQVRVNRTELQRRYFVLGVKCLSVDLMRFVDIYGEQAHVVFDKEFDWFAKHDLARIDQQNTLNLSKMGRMSVDQLSTTMFSSEQRPIVHPEEPELRGLEKSLIR